MYYCQAYFIKESGERVQKISIIIPVYNVYPYLEKCIESIANQSYSNLEIVVVNDCSTDDSEIICKKLINKYENIQYYKLNQNKGVAYARNYGLDKASGSLIGFVDSDDWIESDMYQNLYATMTTFNSPIASCNYTKYTYTHDNILGKLNYLEDSKVKFVQDDICIDNTTDALYYCLHNNDVAVWNKLFDRKLFDYIKFPVGKISEDVFVMHLLIENATKIAVTKQILYNYVIRSDSITAGKVSKSDLEVIHDCIDRYEYLSKKYKSSRIEKLCRAYIFGTLCYVVERFVRDEILLKNEERDYIYNKLYLVHHKIFSEYSYANCGFDKNEENGIKILERGIQYYKNTNAVLLNTHPQIIRSICAPY